MPDSKQTNSQIVKKAIIRFSLAPVLLAMLFFWPAGTWSYWEAWVYIAILILPMSAFLVYLIRNNPETLRRRMETRERNRTQGSVTAISGLLFVAAFLIPGFDKRFGWSDVPLWLIVAGQIVTLGSYLMFGWTILANQFAARTVRVETGQQVIDTGPYGLVRHPMYLAISSLFIATPLALGSFWAILPGLGITALFFLRVKDEEELLLNELNGYEAYRRKVRFRIFPGIW